MSSPIKSLASLIAIVGLALASYASLVNGESSEYIPSSLSELGDFDSLDWVKVVRSECKAYYRVTDNAFELLKKLDKIYASLDDDAKINRNQQKIVEQFGVNQIDGDQFCTEENLRELAKLSACYHTKFITEYDRDITNYRRSVFEYLHERKNNIAFVCRPYVLKSFNKRVEEMNETDRHDMEQKLGNKLVLLQKSGEHLVKYSVSPMTMIGIVSDDIKKISPKWMAILLEFLKEKSGNNLDAKRYITIGNEGREEFNKLFEVSVVDMCQRWWNIGAALGDIEQCDGRVREDYTEKEATWKEYADVCSNIVVNRKLLVKSLYNKMKSEWSQLPLTISVAMKRGVKKMSHSGAKKH